jgi:hypothetical protein
MSEWVGHKENRQGGEHMFSLQGKRLGIPGVISVIALVFAMAGGAWAAKKYVITSTKQIKPSVLSQLKGAAGPAGLAGPAGPSGAPGAAGAKGTTGPKGATGVAGEEGEKGATGEEGLPWTAGGTLPKGATETGTWSAVGAENEAGFKSAQIPISFPIPLKEDIPGENVHVMEAGDPAAAGCTGGTPALPKADEGHLCIYTGKAGLSAKKSAVFKSGEAFEFGASKAGAVLVLLGLDEVLSTWGTWAVTGK